MGRGYSDCRGKGGGHRNEWAPRRLVGVVMNAPAAGRRLSVNEAGMKKITRVSQGHDNGEIPRQPRRRHLGRSSYRRSSHGRG